MTTIASISSRSDTTVGVTTRHQPEAQKSHSCKRTHSLHHKLPALLLPFISDVYLSGPAAMTAFSTPLEEGRAILDRLAGRIETPEPEIESALQKANDRLVRKGLPPVDFVEVTREIESIARDPNRTDKEKRAAMNDVRKRLGLSKGEMKKIFTGRLANLYAEAVKDLRSVEGSNANLIQLRQQLEATQGLYKSMYKPGGCIKKVFSGVGKFFKKVAPWAAALLPVLGPVAATVMKAVSVVTKVVSTVKKVVATAKKVVSAVQTGIGVVKDLYRRGKELWGTVFG